MTWMGTFLEYERPSTVAGCLFSQYTLMESLVDGSGLALNPRGSTTASRTRRTYCTSGRWISMVALSFGRWGNWTQTRLSPTGSQPVRNTVITIEATMNVRMPAKANSAAKKQRGPNRSLVNRSRGHSSRWHFHGYFIDVPRQRLGTCASDGRFSPHSDSQSW